MKKGVWRNFQFCLGLPFLAVWDTQKIIACYAPNSYMLNHVIFTDFFNNVIDFKGHVNLPIFPSVQAAMFLQTTRRALFTALLNKPGETPV